MERLTERDGEFIKWKGRPLYEMGPAEIYTMAERLAAYEDSGLTPEEIKDSCTPTTVTIMAGQALGVHPCRLRELAEADKDGRVVVLPCKVYETDGVRVYEHAVRGIIYRTAGGPDFDESTIGKSIFLTREEAERAMQEKAGKR